ncbi:MAG: hypothetical protein HQL49_10580 [Gammaproteobacteria bacterium]|nr:hypothetical protein [Gammaproteobacteria bacterium]
MISQSSIDVEFEQLVTPVLTEFGFDGGIKELVREQLSLMIQSKIDHYEAEMALYAQTMACDYETAMAKSLTPNEEEFEADDIANDWRFAYEATTAYRKKLEQLLNA